MSVETATIICSNKQKSTQTHYSVMLIMKKRRPQKVPHEFFLIIVQFCFSINNFRIVIIFICNLSVSSFILTNRMNISKLQNRLKITNTNVLNVQFAKETYVSKETLKTECTHLQQRIKSPDSFLPQLILSVSRSFIAAKSRVALVYIV